MCMSPKMFTRGGWPQVKTRFEIAATPYAIFKGKGLIFSGRRSSSARRCEHFSHDLIVLGCSRPFFLTSLPLCWLLQHLAPALLLLIVRRSAERASPPGDSLSLILLPTRHQTVLCYVQSAPRFSPEQS
jgi:hypothetical protein